MPTTLGAADRHPAGQLEDVDDATGFVAAVDDEEESLDPDDFCEDPDDFSDEPVFSEEPLVAAPTVTDDPERDSVRESVR